MIITAVISAIVSYLLIGGILLLNFTIWRRLTDNSQTPSGNTSINRRETAPVTTQYSPTSQRFAHT